MFIKKVNMSHITPIFNFSLYRTIKRICKPLFPTWNTVMIAAAKVSKFVGGVPLSKLNLGKKKKRKKWNTMTSTNRNIKLIQRSELVFMFVWILTVLQTAASPTGRRPQWRGRGGRANWRWTSWSWAEKPPGFEEEPSTWGGGGRGRLTREAQSR